MRSFLFILMLVPIITFAQSDEQKAKLNKKSDGNFKLTTAGSTTKRAAVKKTPDQKKLKDDIVYTGGVKFLIGGNEVVGDSAVACENEGLIKVYNVTVTNPESFIMKGDSIIFNKGTTNAAMKSNIQVTARNGAVVGTSDGLDFDFTYDIYRIVGGSITPLAPTDKK